MCPDYVTQCQPGANMPKHHTIDGTINVTTKGAEKLPPQPVHITLDPAGIDMFWVFLHAVYAHMFSMWKITEASPQSEIIENRKAAHDYLKAHVLSHRMTVNAEYEDHATVYTVGHMKRTTPVVFRVDPRKKWEECIEVRTPSGVFASISLDFIKVMPPPGT